MSAGIPQETGAAVPSACWNFRLDSAGSRQGGTVGRSATRVRFGWLLMLLLVGSTLLYMNVADRLQGTRPRDEAAAPSADAADPPAHPRLMTRTTEEASVALGEAESRSREDTTSHADAGAGALDSRDAGEIVATEGPQPRIKITTSDGLPLGGLRVAGYEGGVAQHETDLEGHVRGTRFNAHEGPIWIRLGGAFDLNHRAELQADMPLHVRLTPDVRGRVVGPDGRPLEQVHLLIQASDAHPPTQARLLWRAPAEERIPTSGPLEQLGWRWIFRRPVLGVRVASWPTRLSTRSDERGRFAFVALRPRTPYTIWAATDEHRWTPVRTGVQAGEDNVKIMLSRARFQVRVRDAGTGDVLPAHVEIARAWPLDRAADRPPPPSFQIQEPGTVAAVGSRWFIRATAPHYVPAVIEHRVPHATNMYEIEMRLARRASLAAVHIRLTTERGRAVRGLQVSLRNAGPPGHDAVDAEPTDDGYLFRDVDPGTTSVVISGLGRPEHDEWRYFLPNQARPVAVGKSGRQEVAFTLREGGAIRVEVQDPDPQPDSGERPGLYLMAAGEPHWTTWWLRREDGTWTSAPSSLPEGDAVLASAAIEPGVYTLYFTTELLRNPYEDLEERISVAKGQTTVVRVRLEPR